MVEGSAGRVEVNVLGPFEVLMDGEPVELPPGRLPALLAVLAMSAGRAVSMDRLTEAIWGDDEWPSNVRRTLQTYVLRLRSALGAEAIETGPAGYALQVDSERVDALRFVRSMERPAGADSDPAAERARLVEALGWWRGSPFEGLESRWLRESEAGQLRERWLSAMERKLDLDLAAGRARDLVSECET